MALTSEERLVRDAPQLVIHPRAERRASRLGLLSDAGFRISPVYSLRPDLVDRIGAEDTRRVVFEGIIELRGAVERLHVENGASKGSQQFINTRRTTLNSTKSMVQSRGSLRRRGAFVAAEIVRAIYPKFYRLIGTQPQLAEHMRKDR